LAAEVVVAITEGAEALEGEYIKMISSGWS
jgi:hypothetical protein